MRQAARSAKGLFMVALFLAGGVICPDEARAAIQGTKHDLSYTSPASVKAQNAADSQICIFCHTPHNANPAIPLWNHNLTSSATSYTLYTSATLQATYPADNRPDGSSKLCLSCHDGTVAVGGLTSGTVGMMGVAADGTMPATRSDLGTNLSNDHPVSVSVNASDLEIRPTQPTPDPSRPAVQYKSGKVQCTSCHDPHTPNKDPLVTKFLVMANNDNFTPSHGSQLCQACHNKTGWTSSGHYGATDTYSSGTGHPYDAKAVATWACEACHTPHTASRPVWTLNDGGTGTEEGVCYRCHSDSATQPGDDVKPATDSGRGHRLGNYTGTHKPVGDGSLGTEATLVTTKHVECSDCHAPHRTQVQTSRSMGSNVVSTYRGQALLGLKVRDVTYGGVWMGATFGSVKDITFEYELCFRCHSTGSTAFTAGTEAGSLDVYFNTNNQAHHAVYGPGRIQKTQMNNTFVVGSGITINSTIFCSDCHDPHATNAYALKTCKPANADSSGRTWICYDCHRADVYSSGASNASLGAWTNHAKAAHHAVSNFTPPSWYPAELRNFSCLWCHGDFGTTPDGSFQPGGIHGANRGSTTYAKVDSGVHFLNGVVIEWQDNGGTSRTCGDYWTGTTGCNHHDGTSAPSVKYTTNW